MASACCGSVMSPTAAMAIPVSMLIGDPPNAHRSFRKIDEVGSKP